MLDKQQPLLLVVDDEPTNLHILIEMLRSDYRIRTATSGRAALKLAAAKQTPELILMDVMMPDMSGMQALQQLRKNPQTSDIPVILISADSSEQTQASGLEYGADEYLTKPVSKRMLNIRVANILQRKQAQMQAQMLAHVFKYCGDAMMLTDHQNRIIDINSAFLKMCGYTREEVLEKNPSLLSSGITDKKTYQAMWQAINQHGFWQGEVWDRRKDGGSYPKLLTISVVRNHAGDIQYHIGSFTDLSEQKAIEAQIRYTAHHDTLTGLPNRLYLQTNLTHIMSSAQRNNSEVALMFIDLDKFKIINDTLGHHIGDMLLKHVAQRLKSCIRESDILARLGGDEFVIAIHGSNIRHSAKSIAQKTLITLRPAYQLEEHEVFSSPSIGISTYPHDTKELAALMQYADTAMYKAKTSGRNNYQFYDQQQDFQGTQKLQLMNRLRKAVELQQLELFFQPQVEMSDNQLHAAEALIRWRDPQQPQLRPPADFIPLAEENGFIHELGDWILEHLCWQLSQWQQQGLNLPRIALNLTPTQFCQSKLEEKLLAILQRHQLAPAQLELEITELSLQNAEQAMARLTQLRDMGIQLVLDNFGNGQTSLKNLRHLPFHKIKIDQAFIQAIESSETDKALLRSIIQLAHSLAVDVTAEGVESASQWQFLQQQHCRFAQGFWIKPPLSPQEFETYLKQTASEPSSQQ